MSQATHEHYDHYTPDMVKRLDGVYGVIDDDINRRIAREVYGQRVLDIGCGFGSLVEMLRLHGKSAVGIDLLEHQITAAQDRFPDADLRLVKEGPLPFDDDSFDTVILKDALHHLADEGDIDGMMAEIRRVCSGRVIVFEPNPCVPLKAGRALIGHVDPVCAPSDARGILERGGFRVTKTIFSDVVAFPLSGGFVGRPLLPRSMAGLALRLDRVLSRISGRLLSWRYLTVAERR